MKARDFAYWLQGYFEISNSTALTEGQVETVKNHLAMVFKHEIDPSNGTPEHNQELAKLHGKTGGGLGGPATFGSGGSSIGAVTLTGPFDTKTAMNC